MNQFGPIGLGLLTTAVFLGVGVWLWMEGNTGWGAAVTGLGVVRGVLAGRQAMRAYGSSDDEE